MALANSELKNPKKRGRFSAFFGGLFVWRHVFFLNFIGQKQRNLSEKMGTLHALLGNHGKPQEKILHIEVVLFIYGKASFDVYSYSTLFVKVRMRIPLGPQRCHSPPRKMDAP